MLPALILAMLVALNALYVAAEFAAVAVEKSQIAVMAQRGNRRAVGLLAILDDGAALDRYIAACQIGITISSLLVGAYGQATIGIALVPWFGESFGLGASAAQSTAFIVVLLFLTTLQVVLGELVPKSLALQFRERTALLTYPPVRWSVSAFSVFIRLLNGSGFLLLKPFGIKPGGHQHVHSPKEIEILLAASQRGGALTADAHRRLDRGLKLSARTVGQMMTPRAEIHAIEVSTPAARVLERILDSPYSRIPVYRDSLDHILGAISTKQVVGLFAANEELPPLEQLLRPMPFVSQNYRSHRLVRFLQQQRRSKAIVVDEQGVVVGVVSIEDVLSELFGEIGDELKHPDARAHSGILPSPHGKPPEGEAS